jgi:CheY-like chemotaxis protein
MKSASGTILLVEDNEDDIFFMRRALRAAQISNTLKVVQDGQAAVDYLAGIGLYANRSESPMPCLVLLDLKLPIRGGLDVLAWIDQTPALRSLIVIVLTTSREPNDVQCAYRFGAKSYVVKPTDVTVLVELLRSLKNFWLTFNEFAAH